MVIATVAPESVSIAQVRDLIRAFGIDTRDLHTLQITPAEITAEFYLRDSDGQKFMWPYSHQIAMKKVVIPITRPEAPVG